MRFPSLVAMAASPDVVDRRPGLGPHRLPTLRTGLRRGGGWRWPPSSPSRSRWRPTPRWSPSGRSLFPATKGYVHFQFADYAKLTVIGVRHRLRGLAVVARVSSAPRWLFFRAGHRGDPRALPARRLHLAAGAVRPGGRRADGDARGHRADHLQPAGPPGPGARRRPPSPSQPPAAKPACSRRAAAPVSAARSSSTSASTSAPGRHRPAATLAAICSGVVAPAMTEATAGRESSHPKARSSTLWPWRRASSSSAATRGQPLVGELAGRPVAHGGQAGALGRRLARPVLAAQEPAGQGEVGQEGQARCARTRSRTPSSGSRWRMLYWFCTLTNPGRARRAWPRRPRRAWRR